MQMHQKKVRALGLCSGGLDSSLAAAVLSAQGIDVHWITFETPFFSADKARTAAQRQGIPLIVENITAPYLEMLQNPPCGYGKYMNPCMDCHAMMFELAGRRLGADGFDFLFSGEVVGQRPMSQTKPSLRYVEKHSGYQGLVLRPLSARLLPETLPEQQGLVDRERLLALSGRSRKPQIQMAADFGITQYPAPAGGCLLTDKGYANRLRELMAHQDPLTEAALHLLKYGRHFRLPAGKKIIVGRTRQDNVCIENWYDPRQDTLVRLQRWPGPLVLVPGAAEEAVVKLAAGMAVGYSKAPPEAAAEVTVRGPGGASAFRVLGVSPGDVKKLMI